MSPVKLYNYKMKKIIFVLLVFLCVLFFVNANEKNGTGINDWYHGLYAQKFAAQDPAKFNQVNKTLGIIHPIFAGITYAGLYALDGLGIAMTYLAFTNPKAVSYSGLRIAHLAVAVPVLVSFASVMTIGMIKAGLKAKNGHDLRKPHFIAAFVTLGLYALELVTMILSGVYFANDLPGKKWVALAHGIVCGATTLAFTVSFITIFL
jgi:hypothetical protein